MEIIKDENHRVLAYLVEVEGQGYHPTADEINHYAISPSPTTAPYEYPSVKDWLDDVTYNSGSDQQESAAEWLLRIDLAEERDGKLFTTELGRALLAAANQRELEQAASATVALVLRQDDDFAIAMVMARIAEAGEAALVDPYRILTGPSNEKSRLGAISSALAVLNPATIRIPAVRVTDVFHDRYLIPTKGPVWMLGTSLNGIGRKTSMMVQVSDEPAGQAIRSGFDEAWGSATDITAAVGSGALRHRK
jgi:hypothetical protein